MLFGNFAESRSKDLRDPIDEEEFSEDYGYVSDSDLEDDEDETASSLKHAPKSETPPFDPLSTPGEEKIGCEGHLEHIAKGKVVKVPDISFVTWVVFGGLFNFSLIPPQISSFFDISLHRSNGIRAIWIGRESQGAKGRSLSFRRIIPSTLAKVYLPTCR